MGRSERTAFALMATNTGRGYCEALTGFDKLADLDREIESMKASPAYRGILYFVVTPQTAKGRKQMPAGAAHIVVDPDTMTRRNLTAEAEQAAYVANYFEDYPEVYLSKSVQPGRWSLINKGLCQAQGPLSGVLNFCKKFKFELPEIFWEASTGQFKPTAYIKETA